MFDNYIYTYNCVYVYIIMKIMCANLKTFAELLIVGDGRQS